MTPKGIYGIIVDGNAVLIDSGFLDERVKVVSTDLDNNKMVVDGGDWDLTRSRCCLTSGIN